MKKLVFLIVLASLLCSCDVLFPDEGNLGQPCTAGGACLSRLECIDDVCVNPNAMDGDHEFNPDGDIPPDGDIDGPSDGDEDSIDGDTADGDDETTPDGDESEADQDVEEDSDTETVCVCSSGPCCDGCNYRDSSYVCDDNLDVDYQCAGSACGDDAQTKTQVMNCSGVSADCNGSKSWGEWTMHENCGSDEKCDSDNESYASCTYNAYCATTAFSCSNGVCTDPATGFEWQETPTGGQMGWEPAKTHCTGLTLDGSGWRLPNISELRSLIRNCSDIETGGACGVKDECSACGVSSGDTCLLSSCSVSSVCNPDSCSNDGGPTGCYWPPELSGTCSWYWSSSPVGGDNYAWGVNFGNGNMDYNYVTNCHDVRCVR